MIKYKKTNPNAVVPYKKHKSDACYDMVATSINDLGDGRIEYGLGLAMEPLSGHKITLKARSSIHKTGLILSNGVGVGDEGYTGEYKVVFYNIIPSLPNYKVGDRICQMEMEAVISLEFIEGELNDTDRGDGGFGSTGNDVVDMLNEAVRQTKYKYIEEGFIDRRVDGMPKHPCKIKVHIPESISNSVIFTGEWSGSKEEDEVIPYFIGTVFFDRKKTGVLNMNVYTDKSEMYHKRNNQMVYDPVDFFYYKEI